MRVLITLIKFGLFSQLCSFASQMQIAGALGPSKYGSFAFGLTLQYWLALVGSLGARPVLVREVAQAADRHRQVFAAHLILNGTPALAMAIAGWAIIQVAPVGSDERTLIGCILIGNMAGCLNPLAFFDAWNLQVASMRMIAVIEFGALCLVLCLRASDHLTVGSVGAIWLGKAWISLSAHCAMLYLRGGGAGRLVVCVRTMAQIVRSSLPVMAASAVSAFPLAGCTILVRWWGDSTEVAFLGIAVQAASAFSLFAAYPLRILYPEVLATPARRPAESVRLSRAYVVYLVSIWFGGVAGGGVLTHQILQTAYRPALVPIVLLLTAALIQAVGNLPTVELIAQYRENRVLACQSFATLVYFIGTVGLVPYVDYNGAAWAAVGACLLSSATIAIQASRSKSRRSARGGDPVDVCEDHCPTARCSDIVPSECRSAPAGGSLPRTAQVEPRGLL